MHEHDQTPIIPQYPPEKPSNVVSFQDHPPEKPSRFSGLKGALSTILILIAAPLIALFLTTFVFQSYEVDGQSMESTLQDNDRLIVLKTGKTWASLFNRDFIPARGEVVVFNLDSANSAGGQDDRQLIKRVIALPGERVVVKNGSITVYNKDFPEGFNPDRAEEFRNHVSPTTPGDVDEVVPDDHVFVCGDNRENSHDSRYFGSIPSESIVGTLAVRIYPFSKFEVF